MNVATILRHKGTAVVTLRPEMTMLEAAQALAEHRIGAAVVVDSDGGISGIVSERDIVRAISKTAAESFKLAIRDVMTAPVKTCLQTDSIDEVMAVMTTRRFRHMPVVEGGRLKGIVSIGDVVKLRIAETELEVAAMREYIAAS